MLAHEYTEWFLLDLDEIPRHLEHLAGVLLHWNSTIPQEGEVWWELDEIVRTHLNASHLRMSPRHSDHS